MAILLVYGLYALIFACFLPFLTFFVSFVCHKFNMAENNAVALKLPQFWPNLPAHWFLQVESQFSTRGIVVEKTKYDYVISSLSQDAVASVYDIMADISTSAGTDHPINDPYTQLKKHLIERHTLSESSRIETLLSGLEMGDKKPSEFFRSMKTLAGTSDVVSDKLILSLWMRRLPALVQAPLKAMPKQEIADQLSMADSIYEVFRQEHRQQASISSLSNSEPNQSTISNLVTQNKRLEKEMSELKNMISRLSTNSGDDSHRSRSRNRNNSGNRSRSRSKPNNQSELCWYHETYGDKASKCRKPCSFKTHPN